MTCPKCSSGDVERLLTYIGPFATERDWWKCVPCGWFWSTEPEQTIEKPVVNESGEIVEQTEGESNG